MTPPRPRARILENLEAIYQEAYQRAKVASHDDRMLELDASFQREQLLMEILLDIRDGLYAIADAETESSALAKLKVLRTLTKLR